jgi:signal transduction histidine kinase
VISKHRFVSSVSFVVPLPNAAPACQNGTLMADRQTLSSEAALEELRRRYAELAALAGSLAHEIKNPLSVIRMNMDLLAEDFGKVETPKERRAVAKIEMVSRQCTRLENLLNDFLRFNKVSQLELTLGSLNEQTARVLDLFTAQADESNIEIVRYLDADLPSIMLNAETLQAALVNLVKNALEAMPDGGQLTARTRVTRQGVALDLIDTGLGMDERTAMKMFDPFYTTKSGGSGLGLPTARRIIEAHGGRIDVDSEVGVGTQFTLAFPTPARLAGDATGE